MSEKGGSKIAYQDQRQEIKERHQLRNISHTPPKVGNGQKPEVVKKRPKPMSTSLAARDRVESLKYRGSTGKGFQIAEANLNSQETTETVQDINYVFPHTAKENEHS